jgi:hypothetical protein
MLLWFFVAITLLSFVFLGLLDILIGCFRDVEKNVQQAVYFERINKEKYLEEVGCNFMSDPW